MKPRTPARKKPRSILESAEKIAGLLADFDFHVATDDFILTELAQLIEEDRASFDDEEFRILVDEGIRIHIAEKPSARAGIAKILRIALPRMDADTRLVASRVLTAIEDDGSDLSNAGVLVKTYTSYLLRRLEAIEPESRNEEAAREFIERWRAGELPRQHLVWGLAKLGADAAVPTADLLFESLENRESTDLALDVLAAAKSPISARVLAYAVSEPMLDEDSESKAFSILESMWPLPRDFVLYSLRNHSHEDLPVRWFELLVRKDELSAVDLALEEVAIHGSQARYREDLSAVIQILRESRDPGLEDKVIGTLNAGELSGEVAGMLEAFLREYSRTAPESASPWIARETELALNQRYREAARLWDSGKVEEAGKVLGEILEAQPGHPFASMLREVASG